MLNFYIILQLRTIQFYIVLEASLLIKKKTISFIQINNIKLFIIYYLLLFIRNCLIKIRI